MSKAPPPIFIKFPSLAISYYLVHEHALGIVLRRIEDHYAQRNLSLRLVLVLIAAADAEASQSTIAASLGINRNVMVDIVDELERRNLLKRVKNPKNRREYVLKPTRKGHDTVKWALKEDWPTAVESIWRPLKKPTLDRIKEWMIAVSTANDE